jgi:hypothetical protein
MLRNATVALNAWALSDVLCSVDCFVHASVTHPTYHRISPVALAVAQALRLHLGDT